MKLSRRIEYKVKGATHVVVVSPEEDGKAKLREKLGLARLPNGVEVISNVEVPITELDTPSLKDLLESETAYYDGIAEFVRRFPDGGPGWTFVLNRVAENLANIKAELETRG